jgi:hypothetical protein
MIIPTFDPVAFKLKYTQFANIPDATLTMLWDGVVPFAMPIIGLLKVIHQTPYWDLAEAHVAEIFETGLNGRVSNATEGSVSGQTVFNDTEDQQTWWNKTAWGQQVWQVFRTYEQMKGGARYIPGTTTWW